jgi:hypothetical protein
MSKCVVRRLAGVAVAVGAVGSPAWAGPILITDDSLLTGSSSGQYSGFDPNTGTGFEGDFSNNATGSVAGNTASGGTSGGIVDANVSIFTSLSYTMTVNQRSDATEIVLSVSGSSIVNGPVLSANVQSSISGQLRIFTGRDLTFTTTLNITDFGLTGSTIDVMGGQTSGSILAGQEYTVFDINAFVQVNLPGVGGDTFQATATVLLVPGPGGATLALVGVAAIGPRRRRR